MKISRVINLFRDFYTIIEIKFIGLSRRNQVGLVNILVVLIFLPISFSALNSSSESSLVPLKENEIIDEEPSESESEVDETPIDEEIYEWVGEPAYPRYITIPSINTSGFVEHVGLDPNNEISVPSNTHLAGWFKSSALPGTSGVSVIDGHVDGYEGDGIFADLAKLKEGDRFTLEMGDRNILRYEVKEITQTTAEDSINVLFSHDTSIESQLNLITCGGNYDESMGGYEDRLIVISELIN